MNKRINRRFHKRLLEWGVIDATQESYWRKKFFEAEYHEAFPIDRNHLESILPEVTKAIKKWRE